MLPNDYEYFLIQQVKHEFLKFTFLIDILFINIIGKI